jgi:cytochrome c oxidase assembly protein subunit 15
MARKDIGTWLLILVAMVFVTVVLGGLTRLTGSGLSMVDWQPITGWLPPTSDAQWQAVFDLYKTSPQYREVNFDMTVDGFKSIFWLEYIHRLWGRIIGVVFIVPFAYFTLRGRITGRLVPRIGVLFVLGALQGAIGWIMVSTGLEGTPEVSQYALVSHLGAALLIYAYMLWEGLSFWHEDGFAPVAQEHKALAHGTTAVAVLIALTMLAGGFVAGTHAGFIYNTFPLMEGGLFPDGSFRDAVAPFVDPGTVQFDHRVLAECTFVAVIVLWLRALKRLPEGPARLVYNAMGTMVLIQFTLGIATLLTVVAIPIAALHQAGAFILFTLTLAARHWLRGAPPQAARPKSLEREPFLEYKSANSSRS